MQRWNLEIWFSGGLGRGKSVAELHDPKIFSKLNNPTILFEAQQLQEVCKILTRIIGNLAPFHFSAKSMTNLKDLYENGKVLVMKYWNNVAHIKKIEDDKVSMKYLLSFAQRNDKIYISI